MSRRIIAGLAAAGVAILASCSQDRSPNVSLPTEASLERAPTVPTCSFSKANTDAKAYFTNTTGRTADPVFALLDAMQAAPAGATRTGPGFDVLNRTAVARDNGLVKTTTTATAAGVAFVNDVLLCMVGMSPIDARALGTKGLFEVRAGNSTAPVTSLPVVYGAQPQPAGANWPLSQPTLFTGWALPGFTTTVGDTPAGTVFELQTQPSGLVFAPPGILVGVCDIADLTGTGLTARIMHVHGNPVILANVDPTFCPTTTLNQSLFGNSSAPSSMFAFAAQQVASWLSPKPAYAASRAMLIIKKGGGTVGGLSEFGPIQFQDTLEFQKKNAAGDLDPNGAGIPNAKVSDAPKATDGDPNTLQFSPVISVIALSKVGRNPLANVEITLVVTGNKGSFTPPTGAVATTNDQGIAYFPDFVIDKAGGYTVKATAGGYGSTGAAKSNLFNVSGQ
jgi:hypothetical protein